jgi:hypothetical protein
VTIKQLILELKLMAHSNQNITDTKSILDYFKTLTEM